MNNIHTITTETEIKAWYLYDTANSVFATPALAMFIPILLDRLSTHQACTMIECNTDGHPINEQEKLYIDILSTQITPETFAFAILGISVFFQAIFFISFGSYADYGKNKKRFLTINTIAGSITTMLFLSCFHYKAWWIVGILTIISNIFFGLSIVFYNTYLPLLVRNHQDYINLQTNQEKLKLEDNLTNKLSTWGFIYGYIGSLFATIITFLVIFFYPNTTNNYDDQNTNISICICIFLAGIWWLFFGLYSISGLQEREGPEYPNDQNIIIFSWEKTFATIKQLTIHKEIGKFMISYFLYSDAYSTISSCGILYAKRELNTTQLMLTILLLEVTIFSIIGNYIFLFIQKKFLISTKSIVTFQLISYLILSIFGFFFLSGNISLLIFGLIHGLLIGAVQSYTRTLFVQLIPSGCESQFFSLYEISDKGSSWIGPIVLAVISQYVSISYGFLYIIGVLIISTILLQFVDVSKNFKTRDDINNDIRIEINN